MSDPVILAASYLGPEGHGDDRTGLRPWEAPHAANFAQGDLAALHWSLLFGETPSRFARMDLMCRLAFMAAELLEAGFDLMDPSLREHTGVCLETRAGSLASDVQFLQTPRPSVFTYTLPSTAVGELCIRYRLKGPILCLVSPNAGGPTALAEGADWLREGDADAVLCLSCEATDRTLTTACPWPPELAPGPWHAAAVLLGPSAGSPRECPLGSMSLRETALTRCAEANRAC